MRFKPAERENRQKKKPDSSEWTALPGYYEECVYTPTLSGQAINVLEPEGGHETLTAVLAELLLGSFPKPYSFLWCRPKGGATMKRRIHRVVALLVLTALMGVLGVLVGTPSAFGADAPQAAAVKGIGDADAANVSAHGGGSLD